MHLKHFACCIPGIPRPLQVSCQVSPVPCAFFHIFYLCNSPKWLGIHLTNCLSRGESGQKWVRRADASFHSSDCCRNSFCALSLVGQVAKLNLTRRAPGLPHCLKCLTSGRITNTTGRHHSSAGANTFQGPSVPSRGPPPPPTKLHPAKKWHEKWNENQQVTAIIARLAAR